MKSAIITGASGFVGTHLTALLRKINIKVTLYDSRTTNPNTLPQADVFYHLAWDGASGVSRPNPFIQTQNAIMTLQSLETAHKIGCKKFAALGTVYEKLAPQIRESKQLRTPDFYILAKDYAHVTASKLAYKLGIDFTWCTVCHPIGKRIKQEQLMAYTVSSLLAGTPPNFGPAATYFDILAVEDLALGLYLIGEHGKRQEYYIGSGSPRVLKEYLLQVPKILGVDTLVNIGVRDDDGLRFEREWFDITPLVEDAGYSPKVGFEEAVRNIARGF